MSGSSTRLTTFPDRRVWNLSGLTLDQIILDYAVTLVIAESGSTLTVVIENHFVYRIGSQAFPLDPSQTPSLIPLLFLLHEVALSLTVFRDGRLLLKFAGGEEIAIPKDDQ